MSDSHSLVPAGMTRGPSATSADYDGSFDAAEIIEQHDRTGQYPFPLAAAGLDSDVFKLWLAWLLYDGRSFSPEALPWVPVGRAGPVLLLGHRHPHKAEPPVVPEGWFQPVLLNSQAYTQQLRALTQGMREAVGQGYRAPEFSRPEAPLPRARKFSDAAEALEFLVQHFIWPKNERSVAVRMTERDSVSLEDFPAGLRAAVWFLLGRGPIVDVAGLKPSVALDGVIPRDLKQRVLPVYTLGKVAFFATAETDRAELEDRLHAAMPEGGWQMRFLMFDGDMAGQNSEEAGAGAETKVFVGGSAPTEEKGSVTITLDPKLERIDLRSTKNDPKDIFLRLLDIAIRDHVSDLHIEPGLVQARARVRSSGELYEVLGMSDALCRSVVAAGKSLMGMPSEMFSTIDAECSVRRGDEKVNLRVSAMPIRKTYQNLVMRLQFQKADSLHLANLEQPDRIVRLLRQAITRPQGFILVCGPTGSGKTTTLHACLAELNVPGNKIVTLEDPIEYQVEGINQAAVDEARGVTYEMLLQTILRQDPDVVLLGEIRNPQTARIATEAALTGHIVFATLHTLSSSKAILRMLELGVKPLVLAESLLLVQSQRLTRRLCPKCREAHDLTQRELDLFKFHGVDVATPVHYKPGRNCASCHGTGYQDRIAVMDILPCTKKVRAEILRGGDGEAIEALAQKMGAPNLVQEALRHVLAGNITLEEALLNEDPWDILETEGI